MLVLSRKRGERIVIGDSIIVTVLDFHGPNVQIGISAPPEVVIHRQEIAERIERERREREPAPQCPHCGLYYMPGDHHECPEIGAHSKIAWPEIERERDENIQEERRERYGADSL